MTDRELLELAAKALEYVVDGYVDDMIIQPSMGKAGGLVIRNDRGGHSSWNPLTDDGDALRLAVKLDMCVVVDGEHNHVRVYAQSFARSEEGYGACGFGPDKCAATRRAIVRAAAEIGKAMP